MANGRRLRGLGVLLLAGAVSTARGADDACDVERWRTGLTMGVVDTGFAVAAVDDGSAAATGGVKAGDVVVQVNGLVPRSCADWSRAVRDARRDRKALLLLVRRPAGEVPLVLAAAAWDRAPANEAVAARPGEAPARPAPATEPPTVRELVAAPAPSIPPPAQPDLGDVVQRIARLDADPADRGAYRGELAQLHAAVRTLSAGGGVPRGVVSGLETVLRYHDAAAVAWTSEDAARERERRPRRFPSTEAMVAPYFADSDEESAIEAFPFLQQTVVRPPRGTVVESAGLWRPVEARKLLWEGARTEQQRLATWLGIAGR